MITHSRPTNLSACNLLIIDLLIARWAWDARKYESTLDQLVRPILGFAFNRKNPIAEWNLTYCFLASFVGTNSDDFFHRRDEDLSVADLTGLRGFQNCLDDFLRHVVGREDFDFYFRQKIDRVFCAT